MYLSQRPAAHSYDVGELKPRAAITKVALSPDAMGISEALVRKDV